LNNITGAGSALPAPVTFAVASSIGEPAQAKAHTLRALPASPRETWTTPSQRHRA
jgi:hypothetical protein